MNYWLMKSEPTSYSIDDLKRDKCTPWDGVRNYQARNFMRDDMSIGDRVLFYHSNCAEIGVTGEGRVCSKAYPDITQFDKKSIYYDPKSTKDKPIWYLVDICFVKKFKEMVTLAQIKSDNKFKNMLLTQKGSRLSVQPVGDTEFKLIAKMGS